MNSKFLSLSIIGFLFSCANNEDVAGTNQTDLAAVDSSTISINDSVVIELPKNFTEVDTNESVKIITAGTFHSDEVWDDVEKGTWYDIFCDSEDDYLKRTYYLEETEIKVKRVHDPIIDEDETIQTGWEIHVEGKTEILLLIQGGKFQQGNKKQVAFENPQLFPGDSLSFIYGGTRYKLFATGTSTLDYEYAETPKVEDYKLFLTSTKNGTEITALLVEHENFDDAMVSIIFIGDIDGDGIPDLILDTARHYNVDNPTLYLSGEADENQLLQIVGWHRSVGC